jgi:hypothetical protein
MALDAAYATKAQLVEYAAGRGLTLPPDDDQDALLSRATDDVDSVLGDYRIHESGTYAGRKIDPAAETDYTETRALHRAVCAQALYRIEMGEDFFNRPQIASSGPEFSLDQPPSHVGPQTMRELAGSGLMRNTTSVARRPSLPSRLAFERNLD